MLPNPLLTSGQFSIHNCTSGIGVTCPASALAVCALLCRGHCRSDTHQVPQRPTVQPSLCYLPQALGCFSFCSPPVRCSLSPLVGGWYPCPSRNLIYSGQGLALSLRLKELRNLVTSKGAINSSGRQSWPAQPCGLLLGTSLLCHSVSFPGSCDSSIFLAVSQPFTCSLYAPWYLV